MLSDDDVDHLSVGVVFWWKDIVRLFSGVAICCGTFDVIGVACDCGDDGGGSGGGRVCAAIAVGETGALSCSVSRHRQESTLGLGGDPFNHKSSKSPSISASICATLLHTVFA